MLYDMHCQGHGIRFKSARGRNSTGRQLCGGCQTRPMPRFLRNCDASGLDGDLGRAGRDLAESEDGHTNTESAFLPNDC